MDRIENMQTFVRVVESGSFAEVAKQMNVARSVVTRRVSALEAHLGTKLIARTTRKLSLTSSGALYLERCREILGLLETVETELHQKKGSPKGPIRLSLPVTFGLKRLTPLLLDFGQRYPDVILSLDLTDRRARLLEEGLDLAIRITRHLEPNDIARKLADCRLVAVASPVYLDTHGVPSTPDELSAHACLGYMLDANQSGWTFSVEGVSKRVSVPYMLTSSNGEVLVAAAERHMGVTVLPDFMVKEAVDDRRLQPILSTYTPDAIGIYALLPGNRLVPHRVRVLLDFLAMELADPEGG
jgi:DNA-binding transcriptional LysR family regulator